MRVAVFERKTSELHCTVEQLNLHCDIADGRLDCVPFTSEASLRRALRRESFDLLVLDSAASGVTGGLLPVWLRQLRGEAVPILLLGTADTGDDIVRALDQGVDDYLCKPFRGAELGERARRLLPVAGRHEQARLAA